MGTGNRASEGALSIRNADKIYDPGGVNVHAVMDFSMEIEAGEFFAIVGPSGCGKTTLLNAIAGFDDLTGGEIRLDGELIAAPGVAPVPHSERIVVFQNGALFPWKTVIENIAYGPIIQKTMKKKEARAQARILLGKIGLLGCEDRYPGEISSGMRRRVEIVRAMICNPKLLLLDEPFRAMDALTKSVMHEHLLKLYDEQAKTIFFITHDLEESIYLADKVIVMTSRPGTVKTVVKVDLPRPRDFRMLAMDHFIELKQQAIDAVHEEAKKAFEAGERELA